ncbi:unnamed protein product [Caenorhabditis sp. 36 PRJEB53466]|nr:unnamed protein product [Caenorhabditis sp. 36 PRJEB53466]
MDFVLSESSGGEEGSVNEGNSRRLKGSGFPFATKCRTVRHPDDCCGDSLPTSTSSRSNPSFMEIIKNCSIHCSASKCNKRRVNLTLRRTVQAMRLFAVLGLITLCRGWDVRNEPLRFARRLNPGGISSTATSDPTPNSTSTSDPTPAPTPAPAPPKTPVPILKTNTSLRQISDDFSILGRIVNTIAIQEGLSNDSIRLVDLLAELYDLESGNGLMRLKEMKVDPRTVSGELDKILGIVGNLKKDAINDPTNVKNGIVTLMEIKHKLPDFEAGLNETATEDLVAKFENVSGIQFINGDFLDTSKFESVVEQITTIKKNQEISNTGVLTLLDGALKQILHLTAPLLDRFQSFKDYKSKLSNVMAVKDLHKVIEPVLVISQAVREYSQNSEAFISLPSKLSELKAELDIFIPIAAKHQSFSAVNAALKIAHPFVIELISPRTSGRILTRAFPNGAKDYARFPKDIRSEWFKETIACGKDVKRLEDALDHSRHFSEQVSELDASWQKFRNISHVANFTDRLVNSTSSLAKDGEELAGIKDLKPSIETVANAVQSLKNITCAPPFDDIQKVNDYVKNINELIVRMEQAIESVMQNTTQNVTASMTTIAKVANKITNNPANIAAMIKDFIELPEIQMVVDHMNFVNATLSPFSAVKLEAAFSNVPDFSSIKSIQSCLKETGLVGTLKLLQSGNYNSDGVGRVFRFESAIQELTTSDVTTAKVLFDTMDKMKEAVVGVIGKSGTSMRRRRALDDKLALSNLEKSEEVATSVARGVDTLRMMSDVLDKKKQVLAAADAPPEVNAVIGALPTVNASWTSITKESMRKLIKDLVNVDSYAKDLAEETDLLKIGTVFDKAGTVAGVKLNTRLLADSISETLQNSTSQKAKNLEPTFHELGRLELDFASHKDDFTAASLALTRLRTFFDDFFGIDRATSLVTGTEDSTPTVAWYHIVIGGSALVVLIILIFVVRKARKMLKRRRDYIRIDDRRERPDRRRNAVTNDNMHRTLGHTDLHLALKQAKWNEVFRLVHEGNCFINGYMYDWPNAWTPLQYAFKKRAPDWVVEAMLEHGADLFQRDTENNTAMDYLLKIHPKIDDKTYSKGWRGWYEWIRNEEEYPLRSIIRHKKFYKYQMKPPIILHPENFCVHFDLYIGTYKIDKFAKLFRGRCNPESFYEPNRMATHFVVSDEGTGTVDLDTRWDLLPRLFSPTILMTEAWLEMVTYNGLNSLEGWTNDYDYRITKAKYKDRIYTTVELINSMYHQMSIPYLIGAKVLPLDNTKIRSNQTTFVLNVVPLLGGLNRDDLAKDDYRETWFYNDHVSAELHFGVEEERAAFMEVKERVYDLHSDSAYFAFTTESELLSKILAMSVVTNKKVKLLYCDPADYAYSEPTNFWNPLNWVRRPKDPKIELWKKEEAEARARWIESLEDLKDPRKKKKAKVAKPVKGGSHSTKPILDTREPSNSQKKMVKNPEARKTGDKIEVFYSRKTTVVSPTNSDDEEADFCSDSELLPSSQEGHRSRATSFHGRVRAGSDDETANPKHTVLRYRRKKGGQWREVNAQGTPDKRKDDEDELEVDVKEDRSEQTGVVTKTYEARWKVLKYEHLPEWLQDNEFLSILSLHTETGNIWTHLIGCVAFFLLACWFFTRPDNHIQFQEKVVFSFFFVGAVLCLGLSFAFHTLSCHSVNVVKLFCKLDYMGISLLIIGSFIPWIYYGFYCRREPKITYIAMVCVLGIGAIVVSLWDTQLIEEWFPADWSTILITKTMLILADTAKDILLSSRKMLEEVSGPVKIFGDFHGQFEEIEIFETPFSLFVSMRLFAVLGLITLCCGWDVRNEPMRFARRLNPGGISSTTTSDPTPNSTSTSDPTPAPTPAPAPPKTPVPILKTNTSLRQISDDFSILGRIVNTIAIQEGLSNNSIRLVDLLAELYDLESGKGLMRLKEMKVDPRTVSGELDKILGIVGNLKKDAINDPTNVKNGIVTLMEMKDKLPDLEAGLNETATEDLVTKFKIVSGPLFINGDFLDTSKFESVVEQITTIKKNQEISDTEVIALLDGALKQILQLTVPLLDRFQSFKDYKSKLSNVMAVKDLHKVIEPVLVISQAVREYSQNSEAFISLPSKLSELKAELDIFIPIAAKHQSFSAVSAALKIAHPFVIELISPRTSGRILTRAFPNGAKDYAREQVSELDASWQKFRNISHVANFTDRLVNSTSSLAKDGEELAGIKDLKPSIETVANAVQSLKNITCAPPFDDIQKVNDYVKNINELIVRMEQAIESVMQNTTQNVTASMTTIAEVAKKIKKNPANITAMIKDFIELPEIQMVVDHMNFVNATLSPFSAVKLEAVFSNVPDFSSIKSIQSCLKETGLVGTLKLLQSSKYDSDGVGRVFRFGRAIQELTTSDVRTAKVLFDTMDKMKEAVVGVIGKSGTSMRRRRALDDKLALSNLEKSEEVATSVARGVDTLRMMSDVLDKKKQVLAAADAPPEVNAVIGALPTVNASWTSITKESMRKLIKDLVNVDSYAKDLAEETDLLKIGTVFDKAGTVAGVKLNTRLLADSISETLQNSTSQKAKNLEPTFHELGRLELDFASHKDDFTAATLALTRLRTFFDDFFGIDRATSLVTGTEDSTPNVAWYYIVIGVGALVALIILIFVVRKAWKVLKRRRDYIRIDEYLKDPLNWRHNAFTNDNMHRTLGHTDLHLALKQAKWNEVFRLVHEGNCFINGYMYDWPNAWTPLQYAFKKRAPDWVVVAMLEHGADLFQRDTENNTAMDYLLKIHPKIDDKTYSKGWRGWYEWIRNEEEYPLRSIIRHKKFYKYQMKPPIILHPENFCVHFDLYIGTYKIDKFAKLFRGRCNPESFYEPNRMATHFVVSDEGTGTVDLDTRWDLLPRLFSPTILMTEAWLEMVTYNGLNSLEGWTNDYDYRITKAKYKDRIYTTVELINSMYHQMSIPYLIGAKVLPLNNTKIRSNQTTFVLNVVPLLGGLNRDDLAKDDYRETWFYNDHVSAELHFGVEEERAAFMEVKERVYDLHSDSAYFAFTTESELLSKILAMSVVTNKKVKLLYCDPADYAYSEPTNFWNPLNWVRRPKDPKIELWKKEEAEARARWIEWLEDLKNPRKKKKPKVAKPVKGGSHSTNSILDTREPSKSQNKMVKNPEARKTGDKIEVFYSRKTTVVSPTNSDDEEADFCSDTELLPSSQEGHRSRATSFHGRVRAGSDDETANPKHTVLRFGRLRLGTPDKRKDDEDELEVDVKEDRSEQTGVVTKTYEARWKVLKYEHLPEWLQDNEFLRHGHRPPLPSFSECFKSILSLHTETGNIWTHLIGCVAFFLLACWFFTRPDNHIQFQEKVVFSFFFVGAVLCLGLSFAFHTLSCHSVNVVKLFCKLDYMGISLLIIGSFIPWIYYGFYCRREPKITYIAMVCVLGIGAIVVSLWDTQLIEEWFPADWSTILITKTMLILADTAKDILLSSRKMLEEVSGPVKIFGDFHGQFEEIEIFEKRLLVFLFVRSKHGCDFMKIFPITRTVPAMRLFAVLGLITLCCGWDVRNEPMRFARRLNPGGISSTTTSDPTPNSTSTSDPTPAPTPAPCSPEDTTNTSLRQISDDFSILGRIVNTIAIQEGLSNNSIRLVDLLAELYDLESGKGLMRLKEMKVDPRTVSGELDKILGIVGNLKKDAINDPTNVKNGIVTLMEMKDKLPDLEAGLNETATEDLVTKFKIVSGPLFINGDFLDTSKFESVVEQITTIKKNQEISDTEVIALLDGALKQILQLTVPLLDRFQSFKDYKSKLSNVMAVKDLHKVIEPVLVISQAVREYSQNSEAFISLPSKLSELKAELDIFIPIAAKHQSFSAVSAALKIAHPFVIELISPRTSGRILTRAFPNGAKDYARFPKDIRSEWFKEKIACGKDVKRLEDALDHSRHFSEQVSELDASWQKFRNISHVANFTDRLVNSTSSLAKDGEELAGIKDLKPSIETVANAVQSLKNITCAPPFDDIQKVNDYVKNINELIKNPANITAMIKDFIELPEIQMVVDHMNFVNATLSPFSAVKLEASCLKETGLVGTLKLLQSSKYDSDGVGRVFRFGRAIQELTTSDAVVGVIGKSGTSMRRRRALDDKLALSNLEKSEEVATSVARGVDTLRMMSDVLDKKKQVLAAADAPPEVNAVIGALPTVNASWTSITKESMRKLIKDLVNVDSYAKDLAEETDLLKIGTVFDKAGTVAGVKLNTRLLADSISETLQNSTSQKAKNLEPTFHELGRLELDFASHKDDFTAATLALTRLRTFFDDFFGIDRATSLVTGTEDSTPNVAWYYIVIGVGALVALIILIFVVRKAWKVLKRRRDYIRIDEYLKDPLNWRHNAFTNDNMHRTLGHTDLHLALKQAKWNEVFRLVHEGNCFINGYMYDWPNAWTPLQYAFKKRAPDWVVVAMLEHGADLFQRDTENNTAMDYLLKIHPKIDDKTYSKGWRGWYEWIRNEEEYPLRSIIRHKKFYKYQMKPPIILHPENFCVHFDLYIGTYKIDKFAKLFRGRCNPESFYEPNRMATHFVVSDEGTGTVDLDTRWDLLPRLFSPTILMTEAWLEMVTYNGLNSLEGWTNDYDYRITKAKYKDRIYTTVELINSISNQTTFVLNVVPLLGGLNRDDLAKDDYRETWFYNDHVSAELHFGVEEERAAFMEVKERVYDLHSDSAYFAFTTESELLSKILAMSVVTNKKVKLLYCDPADYAYSEPTNFWNPLNWVRRPKDPKIELWKKEEAEARARWIEWLEDLKNPRKKKKPKVAKPVKGGSHSTNSILETREPSKSQNKMVTQKKPAPAAST